MSDPYAMVAGGKLKLKNDTDSKKKKKKKSKDKDKEKEKAEKTIVDGSSITIQNPSSSGSRQLTQAELKFKQMQDKMVDIFIFWFIKN